MAKATAKHANLVLLVVVFVDLLGFGILGPLIPFYVERMGASAELITFVVALYSLAQFAAMPLWGYLSDRIGRRPVLALSMLGHALSYLLIAYADSVWLLAFARIFGGATSANLATAYAYVADTTTPQERAKALGRISAAFGMGFVLGPVFGGLLAGGNSVEEANFLLPALTAAGMSFLSFAGIMLFLPESKPENAPAAPGKRRLGLIESFHTALARPVIGMMAFLCFLVIIFVAMREAILPLWAHFVHDLSPVDIGIMLGISGGTVTLMQIFGIGPLTKRFGEVALVKSAIVLYALGWLGLIFSVSLMQICLALILAAAATAMFQTCLQSLLSQQAGAHERGTIMAVYQSSSSLARFSGQALAGSAYGQINPNAPFTLGVIAMIPAFGLMYLIGRRVRAAEKVEA